LPTFSGQVDCLRQQEVIVRVKLLQGFISRIHCRGRRATGRSDHWSAPSAVAQFLLPDAYRYADYVSKTPVVSIISTDEILVKQISDKAVALIS